MGQYGASFSTTVSAIDRLCRRAAPEAWYIVGMLELIGGATSPMLKTASGMITRESCLGMISISLT